MPRNITVTFADGTNHTYQNAPDDVTPDAVQTRAEKQFAKTVKGIDGGAGPAAQPAQETTVMQDIGQGAKNLGAGWLRGAGSIGATFAAPFDYYEDYTKGDRGKNVSSLITGKEAPSRNAERRARLDENARDLLGADTDSWLYKGGKFGGELSGTAGLAGFLAKGAQAAGAAAPIVNALRTSGMSAGGMTGPSGLALRTAAGAVTGGASAWLVNPEDAATGALVGGATPGIMKAVGYGAQKAGQAVRNAVGGRVSEEVATLAKRAKELGIDIPADRLVNSRLLNAVASGLTYTPFSGRAATEDLMSSQLSKALSRNFGQDSSNVTQALRKASDELGAQFDHTLRNHGVKFDKQLLEGVTEVYNRAEKELGSDALKPIASQIDELVKKGESGIIDGQTAYNIKRTLDRIGRQNTPTAYHALELKGELMEALNRSLGTDKAAAFGKVREQYGNMLSLEKLAKNGAEGEISVARLANMQNINNKKLQEIADIAAQFVKPRESQHGSAQRALVGTVASVAGGLPAAAAGAAAGRATNSVLNSERLRALMLGEKIEPGKLSKLLSNPEAQQAIARTAPILAGDRR